MMNILPESGAPRAHWTNYEVTYVYGDEAVPDGARVKITEGRETLADLPRLIAAANRRFHPDPDKIAITHIEVACSSRTGALLAPWLAEIDRAHTLGQLRDISDRAQVERLFGPLAHRPAEARLLARRLRERCEELTDPATARPPR